MARFVPPYSWKRITAYSAAPATIIAWKTARVSLSADAGDGHSGGDHGVGWVGRDQGQSGLLYGAEEIEGEGHLRGWSGVLPRGVVVVLHFWSAFTSIRSWRGAAASGDRSAVVVPLVGCLSGSAQEPGPFRGW